jgi:(5-formylfuran-3-yl)methyl phosphate synthase
LPDPVWRKDGSSPQLLVSVRNAREAADALEGGADIIDVKEPSRGALGASDPAQIAEVLARVAGRRVVSMAAGELLDSLSDEKGIPDGIRFVKFGLSQCAGGRRHWMQLFGRIGRTLPIGAQVVPVAYADWRDARSPAPDCVLELAALHECPLILVDTFDKSSGGLFDKWSFSSLKKFVCNSRSIGTAVALAGSLRIEDFGRAADTTADIIGVRGAVCGGKRNATLQRQLVTGASLRLQHFTTTPLQ